MAVPVIYQNVVGGTAVGNTLTMTAGPGWGNCGASSVQLIPTGTDGYVEITVNDIAHHLMFGLSNGDTDQTYADIDFAIYQDAGNVRIFQSGIEIGAGYGTCLANDLLSVHVNGTTITFYKNATLLYTSLNQPTFPLLLDSALLDTGTVLKNAVIQSVLYEGGGFMSMIQ